ncbi:NADPH:quinone reductase [Alteribacillus sp. YIM 98480]|uniref:NADPH:quinone reductase n=1 Tax=Alteribacillus sp. YIM 98480 TaxID=2606599 RepID=UPI00131CA743|nr:NADPH:quinone reductase [Alteribacillus sp. YIM 98480]
MKAVVFNQYGGPEVLETASVENPLPKPDEILVKVKASGINPVDTYFRKGIREVPSFPHIPHFDLAGVVVEVGANVESLQIGDRVWATNIKGTAAEFVTASVDYVYRLPDNISFEEGATLGIPVLTAHLSLYNRAQLKPRENVLIYGASGAVGNAAVQLAVETGATVIATASSKVKENIAKKAGAHHVINYKNESLEEKVVDATHNEGIDVILDMSLSENMESDFNLLKTGGRIVAIGSPKNNAPELPWRLLNQKHASLLGVLLFTAPVDVLQHAAAEINDSLASGSLRPHLAKSFKLEEAEKAHKALEANTFNGNIVLQIG